MNIVSEENKNKENICQNNEIKQIDEEKATIKI